MFIVVSTFKGENSRYPWANSRDNWTAHETYAQAYDEYQSLLDDNEVLSASITSVIESTDYSV